MSQKVFPSVLSTLTKDSLFNQDHHCLDWRSLPERLVKVYNAVALQDIEVPWSPDERSVLTAITPMTLKFFESLCEKTNNIEDNNVREAIKVVESISGATKYAIKILKANSETLSGFAQFDTLPVCGYVVVKSCYKFCADLGLASSVESLLVIGKALLFAAQELVNNVNSIIEILLASDLTDFTNFLQATFKALVETMEVVRPVDVKVFTKLTKLSIRFTLSQRQIVSELGLLETVLEFFFTDLRSSLSSLSLSLDPETVANPSCDRSFQLETRIYSFLIKAACNLVEETHNLASQAVAEAIIDFVSGVYSLLLMGFEAEANVRFLKGGAA